MSKENSNNRGKTGLPGLENIKPKRLFSLLNQEEDPDYYEGWRNEEASKKVLNAALDHLKNTRPFEL